MTRVCAHRRPLLGQWCGTPPMCGLCLHAKPAGRPIQSTPRESTTTRPILQKSKCGERERPSKLRLTLHHHRLARGPKSKRRKGSTRPGKLRRQLQRPDLPSRSEASLSSADHAEAGASVPGRPPCRALGRFLGVCRGILLAAAGVRNDGIVHLHVPCGHRSGEL